MVVNMPESYAGASSSSHVHDTVDLDTWMDLGPDTCEAEGVQSSRVCSALGTTKHTRHMRHMQVQHAVHERGHSKREARIMQLMQLLASMDKRSLMAVVLELATSQSERFCPCGGGYSEGRKNLPRFELLVVFVAF